MHEACRVNDDNCCAYAQQFQLSLKSCTVACGGAQSAQDSQQAAAFLGFVDARLGVAASQYYQPRRTWLTFTRHEPAIDTPYIRFELKNAVSQGRVFEVTFFTLIYANSMKARRFATYAEVTLILLLEGFPVTFV